MGNKQSDQEWIERICADTWKELYRFIYYKVQNREEAEDITQETYAKAISYFNRNNVIIQDYTNYLKTISMNIIRDRWRARQHHGIRVNLEDIDPLEMAAEDFADSLEDRAWIQEIMSQLTKEQQTVLEFRIIQGYSVAETAKLMKRKSGTVRVLQFRAVKALAKLLENRKEELS